MSVDIVLPIWQSIKQRFHKMVKSLPEQNLSQKLDSVSVVSLIKHTAEAEFIFMEWFFGATTPDDVKIKMSKKSDAGHESLDELLEMLELSDNHVITCMQQLPQDAWHIPVESPMGTSTPLEAVGRLMYHAGIHAGQISLIQKTVNTQR